MLKKYAELEILDARMGQDGRLARTAHRHEFQYQPRQGFLYVRSRAISSRTNDNFDHFPAEEIRKAWRTFIGKPVFVNHHNDNHRRARGVIIDAALHDDRLPDGQEDTWVEVLMEVDAVRFPKLAKAILAGEIDRTSMGTDVAFSVCSVCNNKATNPAQYCKHIPAMKGQKVRRKTASGDGTEDVLVYEKCYGLGFFENSLLVEDPADPTAFFLDVDDRGVGGGYTGNLAKAASKTAADDLVQVPWGELSVGDVIVEREHLISSSDDDELVTIEFPVRSVRPDGRGTWVSDVEGHGGGEWRGNDALVWVRRTAATKVARSLVCGRCRHQWDSRAQYNIECPKCGAEESVTVDTRRASKTSSLRRTAGEIIPVSRIRPGDVVENIAGYGTAWTVTDTRAEGGNVRVFFSERPEGLGFSATDTLLVRDPAGRGLSDAEFTERFPSTPSDPNNGPGWCPVCGRDVSVRGGRLPRHNFSKNTAGVLCEGSGLTLDEAEVIQKRNMDAYRSTQRNYSLAPRATKIASPEGRTPNALDWWEVVVHWRGDDAGITEMGTGSYEAAKEAAQDFATDPRALRVWIMGLGPTNGDYHERVASSRRTAATWLEPTEDGHRIQWHDDRPCQKTGCGALPTRYIMGRSHGDIGSYVCAAHVDEARRGRGAISMKLTAARASQIKVGDEIPSRQDWATVVSVAQQGARLVVRTSDGVEHSFHPSASVDVISRTASSPRTAAEKDMWDAAHLFGTLHTTESAARAFADWYLAEANGDDIERSYADWDLGGAERIASKLAYGETSAPAKVDTLRDENCPLCGDGEGFNGERCRVCGYIKPPDQFMDPDLSKAQEIDLRQESDSDGEAELDGDEKDDLGSDQFNLTKPDEEADDSDAEADEDVEAEVEVDVKADIATSDPEARAEDDEDEEDDADDEDGESDQFTLKKRKPRSPDDSKDRKKHPRRRAARGNHGEGADVTMRPALRIIAEQQAIIEAQGQAIDRIASRQGVDLSDLKATAGRRIAALRKSADTENPAQPVAEGTPEAPVESTAETLGDVNQDDVEEIGNTSQTDAAPDATVDVQEVGTAVENDLSFSEQDVTNPVQGTTEPNPQDTRTEGDVESIDEVRTDTAFPIEDPSQTKTVGSARTYASLRLARLRIEAGVANGDDLSLAQQIEGSKMSDESIANEINTLSTVAKVASQAPVQNRNLVPRAAARTTPSLAATASTPSVDSSPGAFAPSDDEFLLD